MFEDESKVSNRVDNDDDDDDGNVWVWAVPNKVGGIFEERIIHSFCIVPNADRRDDYPNGWYTVWWQGRAWEVPAEYMKKRRLAK